MALSGAFLASAAVAVGTGMPASAAEVQPELGSRSVPIITADGLEFRDLDRSGDLTPYEDWRLSADERAADLTARLSLEEQAGLLMHSDIPGWLDGEYDFDALRGFIADRNISTYILRLTSDPATMADQSNQIQSMAEDQPFGIPAVLSSDPRSGFTVTQGQTVARGAFTPFPDAIGMGAINDPNLTQRMADVVRQEYRAVGITEALSPQADIATEPRWTRINGTFGSVGTDVEEHVAGYIEGMQNGAEGLNPDSVATVVKHWAGYGAQENGWDSHYYYGRYASFPGDNFAEHLKPYEGAFNSNTAGVMPTYSILRDLEIDGTPVEQVGAGFNSFLLQDLLRDQYGFDGVVTSDWAIVNDCPQECQDVRPPASFIGPWGAATPWGVTDLTKEERFAKTINAGVDSIGYAEEPQYVVDAVADDLLAESDVVQSATRVLKQKFELGLFENPYVDPAAATATVGNADFAAVGLEAQLKSATLLQNNDNTLPLDAAAGTSVYLRGVSADAARAAGLTPTDTLADADVAIIRLSDPRGGSELTDLNFTGSEADYQALQAAHDAGVTTVAVPQLTRPLILENVSTISDAIMANYGISDSALLSVLTGTTTPAGKLPFELPSSMAEVEAQLNDVPNDTANPQFEYGFGLAYQDVVEPTTPPVDPSIPPVDPTTPPTEPSPAPETSAPTADDQLTDATRGSVDVPATAVRGQNIKVTLGDDTAGKTVKVWLHSAPVLLNTVVVAADGTTTVRVPANTDLGAHRVVVQNADGSLYGWDNLRVVATANSSTDPLAFTGSDSLPWIAGGAGVLLLGLGLVVAARLRRNKIAS